MSNVSLIDGYIDESKSKPKPKLTDSDKIMIRLAKWCKEICKGCEKRCDGCLADTVNKLIVHAFNQKVEIEMLEKNDRYSTEIIWKQIAEIEKLQKSGEEAVNCFTRMESLYKIKCEELEIAKSEARREFWNKLKQKEQWDVDLPNYVFVSDGDNLLKEMEDKQNGLCKERIDT